MPINPLHTLEDRARVRGLTLTRPWPWAFLRAGKRVENRKWSAGGLHWLALHAGQGFDHEVVSLFRSGVFGTLAERVPLHEHEHPKAEIFALARVSQVFRLRDGHGAVIPMGRDGNTQQLQIDPWAFGPVCWRFDRLLALRDPVACRGMQGLWRLPGDVIDRVAASAVDVLE